MGLTSSLAGKFKATEWVKMAHHLGSRAGSGRGNHTTPRDPDAVGPTEGLA